MAVVADVDVAVSACGVAAVMPAGDCLPVKMIEGPFSLSNPGRPGMTCHSPSSSIDIAVAVAGVLPADTVVAAAAAVDAVMAGVLAVVCSGGLNESWGEVALAADADVAAAV